MTQQAAKTAPLISSSSFNKYDPYSLKAAVDDEIIAVSLMMADNDSS